MGKINIEVGQEVCLVQCGDNSGRRKDDDGYHKRERGVITKVGRKYFIVSTDHRDTRFRNDNLMQDTNYSADYFIYPSFEDYKEEIDNKRATHKLKHDYFDTFSKITLTVDQCSRIEAIIKERYDD